MQLFNNFSVFLQQSHRGVFQKVCYAAYTCSSLTTQYNLVLTKEGYYSAAGKVTAVQAESNGILLPFYD